MGSKSRNNNQQKKDTNMSQENNPLEAPKVVDQQEVQENTGDTVEESTGAEEFDPNGKSEVIEEEGGAVERLKEEIQPAPTPTPVVEVKPATTPELQGSKYELPLSASPAAAMVISELQHYIESVAVGKRITVEDGGAAQTLLYHTLVQLVNLPAQDFQPAFDLGLRLIRDNMGQGGVFSFVNMHRHTPHVSLTANQARGLKALLNALVALADVNTRESAKRQVDIHLALADRSIKEEARQRVMGYFNY